VWFVPVRRLPPVGQLLVTGRVRGRRARRLAVEEIGEPPDDLGGCVEPEALDVGERGQDLERTERVRPLWSHPVISASLVHRSPPAGAVAALAAVPSPYHEPAIPASSGRPRTALAACRPLSTAASMHPALRPQLVQSPARN